MACSYAGSVTKVQRSGRVAFDGSRSQSVYCVDEAIDDSDKCAAAPSRINLQSEQEPTESRRRASAAVSFYNRDV